MAHVEVENHERTIVIRGQPVWECRQAVSTLPAAKVAGGRVGWVQCVSRDAFAVGWRGENKHSHLQL
jgi:hypothetical protein